MRSDLLRRKFLVAVVLLAVLVAAYFRWRASAVAFDDSYISFRYAFNLIHHRGLVYDPGERVEGYSNFLWVLFAAAALALRGDPLTATRALGVASYLATIALAGAFLFRLVRGKRDLVGVSMLALLVLPAGFAALAGCGLETSFVALLIVVLGLTQHVVPAGSTRRQLALGAIPLLLCLTRLDAALALVASALATAVDERVKGSAWRALAATLLRRFAVCIVGLAVYFVWKKLYYGELMPNTYYAKAADRLQLRAGYTYLVTFFWNSPQVVVLAPAAVLALSDYWDTKLRAFVVYAALFLVAFTAYVVKVGGDFMYYRFAFEAYPLYVMVAAMGVVALCRRALSAALVVAVTAIACATTPPVYEKTYGMQTNADMNAFVDAGREVGVALDRRLPPRTIIATTLAGTVAYYSDLVTIDDWGLNDREIAHQPSPLIHYRGHVKAASKEYLARRGVNLELHHPIICRCSAPCREALPNVFVRVGDDRCVRTWYLTQTDALTEYFCAHPESFVLNNVHCPAPHEN